MKYRKIFPVFSAANTCKFSVWAPKAKSVHLVTQHPEKKHEMTPQELGYWSLELENISPGTRYKYQLNEKESFPDPASLSQPGGVHEASEVIDLNDFEWTDQNWKSIPLKEMIQYELHTGTFTSEGTFAGIRSK